MLWEESSKVLSYSDILPKSQIYMILNNFYTHKESGI